MERGETAWRAAAVKHRVGGVVVVVVSAVVFVLAGRAVAQLFCVAFLLWRLVVLVVRAVRKVVEVDGVGVAWTEGLWPVRDILLALRLCGVSTLLWWHAALRNQYYSLLGFCGIGRHLWF